MIPGYVSGSFTYSIVITEGHAKVPTMAWTETVNIVSAADLVLSINYPN